MPLLSEIEDKLAAMQIDVRAECAALPQAVTMSAEGRLEF